MIDSAAGTDAVWVRNTELHERGLEFINRYPRDPRRWDVLTFMSVAPLFTREVVENGVRRIEADHARRQAWQTDYEARLEQLLLAPDASTGAKSKAVSYLATVNAMNWWSRTKHGGADELRTKLQGWHDYAERNLPHSGAVLQTAKHLAEVLDIDPRRSARFLSELRLRHSGSAFPDPEIREYCDGRLRQLEASLRPLAVAFTDLDGQDVATEKLRGRYVIVAVFPLTRDSARTEAIRLYEQFHAQGVELIQISGAESHDSSRVLVSERELREFAQSHAVSWPVGFDPSPTLGSRFAKSLAITGYPTWILLDRDGVVIARENSRSAFARAVEAELKVNAALSPP